MSGVDFVQWLGVQLDEDERIARAAVRAVGDVPGGVPGAADWRFGNAFTDEGGTYWQITTMPPDAEVFGVVELIGSGMSGGGAHEPEIARHAVEHDPARVLREIDGRRRTLIRCEEAMLSASPMLVHFAKQTVREMALPYVGAPGYAEALASFE